MSYFNNVNIQTSDSPSVDAFARWRVSSPTALFDSKQLYDTGSLIWSTKLIGNATASFIKSSACVKFDVTGSNTAVIRQTKRKFNYQTGKSQLAIITANFSNIAENVIKRVGYYDETNGLYFTRSGSSFGIGLRNNGTDTFVSQSNWNLDKMDGTGKSGNVLIKSASQIYVADMEWLGVGRVRYGVYQKGFPIYVHEISNYNSLSESDPVFMSSPNLPVRYEIISSGSNSGSLFHICSTVVSEGGHEQNGMVRSISSAETPFTANSANYTGMLAIRLKSSSLNSTVLPLKVTTATNAAGAEYEVTLLLNPSGSLLWSWQDLTNSVIQYSTGSATNIIANEGTKILSTIIGANSSNDSVAIDNILPMSADIDGNADVLVVGWRGIQTNATNAAASLTWRETI